MVASSDHWTLRIACEWQNVLVQKKGRASTYSGHLQCAVHLQILSPQCALSRSAQPSCLLATPGAGSGHVISMHCAPLGFANNAASMILFVTRYQCQECSCFLCAPLAALLAACICRRGRAAGSEAPRQRSHVWTLQPDAVVMISAKGPLHP